MEVLYSKLYNKYNTLKKKRLSELDEVNKDQEEKFLNYVSAAEELIEHLRDENKTLRTQVSELRGEVVSIRSSKDEQCAEYQKLLMEENQKNKVLHEEVERLQKQIQEGLCWGSKDGKTGNMLETPQVTSGKVSGGSKGIITRKRSREAQAEMKEPVTIHNSIARNGCTVKMTSKCSRRVQDRVEEAVITHDSINKNDLVVRELEKCSSKETLSSTTISNNEQPGSCKRIVDRSDGGDPSESGHTNCQFQALIEYLVGMKLSTIDQIEGICISALHQSSGYSFTLTWVKKATEDEPELLYRVLTLGTFERVAPEWMRSVLMFSMSMCPIFFERVARVIKLHH